MAKVQVQAVGGSIQSKEADTVGELKAAMELTSYQATVNGEPEGDDYELSDYEFVSLAPKVKGA
jgi:hypothetical protein